MQSKEQTIDDWVEWLKQDFQRKEKLQVEEPSVVNQWQDEEVQPDVEQLVELLDVMQLDVQVPKSSVPLNLWLQALEAEY